MMRRTLGFTLPVVMALAACSGDDGAGGTTTDAGADVASDVAEDAAVDVAPDAGDDASEDVLDGGAADADAADDTSADVAPDATPAPWIEGADGVDLVNVFVGSGGFGFGYASLTPAVQTPNGFAKVGPDTTLSGVHPSQNHFSGYYYPDPHVRGFSHVRLIGTGAADLGLIRVVPDVTVDGDLPPERWFTNDREAEDGAPGWYRTRLVEPAVDVALTATGHGAIHEYTFDGDEGVLFVDAAAAITDSGTVEAHVDVTADGVTGYVVRGSGFAARSREVTVWFAMELDAPASTTGVWTAEGFDLDETAATGPVAGAVLGFDGLGGTPVTLRVGLSTVSAEAAATNLRVEVGAATFDEIAAATREAWAERLSRVRLRAGEPDVASIFYTALYNTYRMPTRLDEGGQYRGFDGEVHDLEGEQTAYLTDLSMWDTFRTLHPWYELYEPELERNVLRSLLRMYEQGGRMPRWPAMLSYTGSMIGSSADHLFAGGAAKNLGGVDYDVAFDALMDSNYGRIRETSENGRSGIERYVEIGWLPAEETDESVSKTLEYAWADASLAVLAETIGRADDAAWLWDRADSHANLFDPDSGFYQPRMADGTFDPVRPTAIFMARDGAFTEGSAWHWRFYAPFDFDGTVELFGDAETLGEELEEFWEGSPYADEGPVSQAVPDERYWHGNEPTIHAHTLFHAAGRYDRLAYWTREVQTRAYGLGPDGIPGNDDGGTLSAWYLFNAIGLYPIAGTDRYVLTTPLVEEAELTVEGTTFRVVAEGASTTRRFVHRVTLDGEPVDTFVRHADLVGGELVFAMSDQPAP